MNGDPPTVGELARQVAALAAQVSTLADKVERVADRMGEKFQRRDMAEAEAAHVIARITDTNVEVSRLEGRLNSRIVEADERLHELESRITYWARITMTSFVFPVAVLILGALLIRAGLH